MTKAATYGNGRKILEDALRNELPFATSGALYAKKSDYVSNYGRLNPTEKHELHSDIELVGIRYVVYSYETPIVWVRNDGHIHRVDQKFSATTSRHQALLWQLGNEDK